MSTAIAPPVYNLQIAQVIAMVAGFTVTQLNFTTPDKNDRRVYTMEVETPSANSKGDAQPIRRFAIQILEDLSFLGPVQRPLMRGYSAAAIEVITPSEDPDAKRQMTDEDGTLFTSALAKTDEPFWDEDNMTPITRAVFTKANKTKVMAFTDPVDVTIAALYFTAREVYEPGTLPSMNNWYVHLRKTIDHWAREHKVDLYVTAN